MVKNTGNILFFTITYFATFNTCILCGHVMRNFWWAGQVIWLWAVSSSASAQTVQRPTVALPSGFWPHWIHSIPKLYTATGTGIVVGLGVGLYIVTDDGDRIYFWNACALVLTDACVGLRIIYCITSWKIRNVQYSWFSKNNVLLVYTKKSLTVNGGLNYVPKEKVSFLTAINLVQLDRR